MTMIREFKFACPACHQHIQCAAGDSGQVVECPTCFLKVIVPQSPTGQTTRLILRAQPALRPPATTSPPTTAKQRVRPPAFGLAGAVSVLIGATLFSAMLYVLMR